MFRRLARIGMVAAIVAIGVVAVAGAAEAAPTGFTARYVHANGAGAIGAQVTGNTQWSESLKTLTLSNVKFYVKGGECAYVLISGWQGTTIVTGVYRYPANSDTSYCPAVNTTLSLGTIALTSGRPGGVQELVADVDDTTYGVFGYANCYQVDSVCSTGQEADD